MLQRKQSTTTYPVIFLMIDSTDHVTPKTGLSLTITISKNGGAFAAATGAGVEIGNGRYSWTPAAGDRSDLGTMSVHVTATGADPFDIDVEILPYDPFLRVDSEVKAVNGVSVTDVDDFKADVSNLSNLDATVSSRSSHTAAQAGTDAASKVLTTPANTLATDGTGQVAAANMRGTDGANTIAPDNTTIGNISSALTTLAGKFTGITLLANWLRAMVRKDAADETAKVEINASGGAYDETTESQEATGDKQDVTNAVTNKIDGLIEDSSGNQFTAKALNQAPSGSGSSPWDETEKDAVVNGVAAIGSGVVTVTGPVIDAGTINIIRGDDYTTESGSALDFESDSYPNLTGATLVFTAANPNNPNDSITATPTVVNAGEVTQTIKVELTAAKTSTLLSSAYKFDIQVTLSNGAKKTPVKGVLSVVEDVTT